jgi:hypothetical protein
MRMWTRGFASEFEPRCMIMDCGVLFALTSIGWGFPRCLVSLTTPSLRQCDGPRRVPWRLDNGWKPMPWTVRHTRTRNRALVVAVPSISGYVWHGEDQIFAATA